MNTSSARPVHKWWTLVAATASLFLIMLDTTIVNVALPAIQTELALDLVELEWTVNAFLLVYAAFLLTGGKLADFFGRKAIFLLGLLVFTASSLACGIADTGNFLIAARAAQGLGAALMLPATQGMIAATFAPHERGMAYGIWGGVSMIGLSLGPLAGGILIDELDWRWIFYVNVPFGILAVVFTLLLVRESKDLSSDQRLDFAGLITSGVFLFALVFGLVEGNNFGWTSWEVLTTFGVAAASLCLFVVAELWQRRPMLDLSMFRNGTFTGANVAALMIMLALLGVLFFLSIYIQNLLGYSAIETGASFMPLTLLVMFVSPISGKLSDSIGPRWPITIGLALLGVGLVLWSTLDLDSGFYDLLPGLIVGGIGIGLAMPPVTIAAVGALPVDRAGVASGVVNTFRQAGGALGIAIMGAILLSSIGDAQTGTPEFARGFIIGLEDAMLLGAAFCAIGATVACLTIRKLEPETEEALEPEPAVAEPISHMPALALKYVEPLASVARHPDVTTERLPAAAAPDMVALLSAIREEVAPLDKRYDELRDMFRSLAMRSTRDRRERIEDLELLMQLVVEGWNGVDRRLGRLEKTIARMDEAQRAADGRPGRPTVVQFEPRLPSNGAEGAPADDTSSAPNAPPEPRS